MSWHLQINFEIHYNNNFWCFRYVDPLQYFAPEEFATFEYEFATKQHSRTGRELPCWAPALGIPAPVVSQCCNARKFDRTRPEQSRLQLQRKLCVTGRYLVSCSPPVELWPSELFPRDCIGAEPSVIGSSESWSRVNETYQKYSASWQIILMTNWPERLCLLSISNYLVSRKGQGLAPSHLSAQKCPEGGEQEMSWSWLWTSLHGLWLHSC